MAKKFYKKVLPNGMRVVVVPMKGNPTVTVVALTEAGSQYEDKKINGLSHFLEHMMFKGTPTRPSALAISHELDALGSQSNAFTWYEFTGYYAKSRTENFGKILNVIADMYQHPRFPEAELERERGVILEEINMYLDDPKRNVGDVSDELLYGDQPAGRTILGLKENIKRLKREDFVKYHTDRYTTKSTTVVVAGDVNVPLAQKKIAAAFKDLKNKKVTPKPKVTEVQKTPQIKIKYKKIDQSHLILTFRTRPLGDKLSPAIEILAAILGQGMSSRLFQKLREEMGVCYYAKAGLQQHTDHGKFEIWSGVDNKRVSLVIAEIMGMLKDLKKNPITKKELSKAKEFVIGNMLMELESSDANALHFGVQEILHQKIKTPQEIIKQLRKVTARDVLNAANDIFKNNKMNLAMIGPNKDVAKLRKVLNV